MDSADIFNINHNLHLLKKQIHLFIWPLRLKISLKFCEEKAFKH